MKEFTEQDHIKILTKTIYQTIAIHDDQLDIPHLRNEINEIAEHEKENEINKLKIHLHLSVEEYKLQQKFERCENHQRTTTEMINEINSIFKIKYQKNFKQEDIKGLLNHNKYILRQIFKILDKEDKQIKIEQTKEKADQELNKILKQENIEKSK